MGSLAVKYRPTQFQEVCSQKSIIQILEKQLISDNVKNCYLFSGPSGCGKTTLARIFANKINDNRGYPIEIDGASNNGVDNVKAIIQGARERAVDSKYKVYIIDECHAITSQGWQSFLKCIEEPPKYTIFLFCTTDAQKIPLTIINRVQKFNLTKIPTQEIKSRLDYICKQEQFTNYNESIDYISKIANGGMRDAISLLEKCASFSKDITIENTLDILGNFSHSSLFDLTNSIIDYNEANVLLIIDNFFNKGNDLKIFIDNYLEFVLDLAKYCIFKDIKVTKIPLSMEEELKYTISIEENIKYFTWLVDKILNIKNTIKGDSNIKTTIQIMLLQICKGI